MAQYIKPGNIFGRIGSGVGKGLSEQLPEEITRGRLATGLKNLSQQEGLTPFQQFAGLASIPGATPQIIQSGAELLKQQALRQAYNRNASQNRAEISKPAISEASNLPEFLQQQNRGIQNRQQIPANRGQEVVPSAETGQPQIVPTNPLRPETATVRPMTPQEKIDDISRLGDDFPNLTYPELKAMSDENEQRRQAQPEAARAEDERLRGIQDRLRNNFRSLLEKKLQKEGPATYSDITGEMENNLIRSMNKELRERPESTEDDVINKWTQKALDLAKAKTQLEGTLESSIFATPIALNKTEYRNGLKNIADVYRKAGNSEEFYNTLKTYGFSPRGAGSLAYETNPGLLKYTESAPKGKNHSPEYNSKNSRKIALDVEKKITPQDSILAVAQSLLFNDPNFVLQDFLDQIREDQDELGLTQRQKRELSEAGHLLPTWPDILVLPWRGFK